MSLINAEDVRNYVLKYLSERAPEGYFEGKTIDDTFDFLQVGIIDSMGLLEMIAEMEEHFKVTVDFEQMDADEFTLLGPFSRYVAQRAVVADVI
jgi:acyl carrier protein